jgi:hypothetical protein
MREGVGGGKLGDGGERFEFGVEAFGWRHEMRFVAGFVAGLVVGDGGVDLAGPGVDAPGDGLGFVEALVAEPGGYGERAGAVVAEDEDGVFFVEFFEGAGGDLVHGDECGGVDAGGVVLPGLADVEKEGWSGGGEEVFGLVDGEF